MDRLLGASAAVARIERERRLEADRQDATAKEDAKEGQPGDGHAPDPVKQPHRSAPGAKVGGLRRRWPALPATASRAGLRQGAGERGPNCRLWRSTAC